MGSPKYTMCFCEDFKHFLNICKANTLGTNSQDGTDFEIIIPELLRRNALVVQLLLCFNASNGGLLKKGSDSAFLPQV